MKYEEQLFGWLAGLISSMREAIYRLMCFAHYLTKKILLLHREPIDIRFVDVGVQEISEDGTVHFSGLLGLSLKNQHDVRVRLNQLYPVENAVPLRSNYHLSSSFKQRPPTRCLFGDERQQFTPELWRHFINRAEIPAGYRNGGLKYAGYIASGRNSWCLPSWIWTNGAIVRYFCASGEVDQATLIGDLLLTLQAREGGWVVRSDYSADDEIPVVAPNDSAYIANNACLQLYGITHDDKYLSAARQCADWIMETARPDGLVWTGYDNRNGAWLKRHTIVDTGFTAGLFAHLYMLTGEGCYRSFLERFVERFIELFYDPRTGGFSTSIDEQNRKIGGRFARGQAWALEGLIPAYRALGGERLRGIVEATTDSLLRRQLRNGGWAYNFDRTYYGEDCKGVPVIAKALLEWNAIAFDERLCASARRAMDWCKARTALYGEAQGGIFSFNMEGAVVHNFYTETAFVYSSAYALESLKLLASYE